MKFGKDLVNVISLVFINPKIIIFLYIFKNWLEINKYCNVYYKYDKM